MCNCKPKEVVITQTLRDTINTHTVERIEVPVDHTIVIEEPCDSLGILRDFKQSFSTGKVNVTVSNHEGQIVAEINLDSIKQVWIKEYEGHNEVIVKEIEVDKPVPYIPKWVWFLLGYSVLSLVYKFRRFIPFLQFLP